MEGAPAYSAIRVGLSDKQRARLRNGHSVRCSPAVEGSGVQLIIDPSRLNNISKCFRAGKGTNIQLSPSEIQANMGVQGEGIFGKKFDRFVKKTIGKKATKELYSVAEKVGKPLVNKGLDALATAATVYAPGAAPAIQAAKRAAKGYIDRPTAYQEDPTGELMKDVNPQKMAMEQMGMGIFDTVKKLAKSKTGKMLQKKVIGMAKKEAVKAGLPSELANVLAGAAEKGVEGQGLYAQSRGRGVMGSGALMGAGYLPPALQSQANSANFMFHTQLPPQYASRITGNGLYA